ncbi:DUF4913 domain-containing protein [Streptomyces alfalfae]|nr:DUF4913 domain-containing protein [Streptomyces fradiae]RXX40294.1 DUF4913 domain-containing protein [Streptomyces alfalfae]RZM96702.1 DUF4913 domain-containing protein [Streptomyces alfalfae]
MYEEIEDLKATVRRLEAQIQRLAGGTGDPLDPYPVGHEANDVSPGTSEPEAEPAEEEEEEPQYPPFILLLDSPVYDEELRALIEWVEGVLVPGYLGEASADARWCPQWMDHDTGVIPHLHALWLAWQELTDPAVCGYTGPSVWHRDHYRPTMTELRAPNGPFQGCTKGEHQVNHRLPGRVPSAWNHEPG